MTCSVHPFILLPERSFTVTRGRFTLTLFSSSTHTKVQTSSSAPLLGGDPGEKLGEKLGGLQEKLDEKLEELEEEGGEEFWEEQEKI